ncbi:MAG: M23 family metallopeptidase [Acidobacteriota bacterium]|nr:M23 family metallopeptidase [Acidobacteriota bacterium]
MFPRREKKQSLRRRALFLLVTIAVVVVALAWFRVGPRPAIEIRPAFLAIGPSTPVEVYVSEPRRGLSTVRVELMQGDLRRVLAEVEVAPRESWRFWGDYTPSETFELEVGSRTIEGLKEGEATIRVEAQRAATWLRHPKPGVAEVVLAVRLRPPSLEILSTANYAEQGGSGLVVYRPGKTSVRDGVQAGDHWFPGFPLPDGAGGDDGRRFALFGVPYDLEEASGVVLVAEDEVGNRSEVPFLDGLKVHPLRRDTINVDDAFLARVVPRILAETPELQSTGDLLQDYLRINGDLRQANAEVLAELGEDSEPRQLWQGAFLQLPGSQVMSSFADRRTYVYQGRDVDQQDHLGFDLASVRAAAVPSSNAGRVVLARYLGIYGRTVVVDHGYGLLSLYAHLSRIEVEEGQQVARGETVGHTGATGLAGGDHLHFTLLLQDLAVNPVEWWDGRWVQRRIEDRLQGAAAGG